MSYFGSYMGGSAAAVCDYPDPAYVKSGVVYGDGAYTGTYGSGTNPTGPHSPADILCQMLQDMGLVGLTGAGVWPAQVSSEPNTPDNTVTLTDTSGIPLGRKMTDGSVVELFGFQVRVRANSHTAAFAKAEEIRQALLKDVYRRGVLLGDSVYVVHAVSGMTNPVNLGTLPDSNRVVFVLNGLATIKYPEV